MSLWDRSSVGVFKDDRMMLVLTFLMVMVAIGTMVQRADVVSRIFGGGALARPVFTILRSVAGQLGRPQVRRLAARPKGATRLLEQAPENQGRWAAPNIRDGRMLAPLGGTWYGLAP